MNKDDPFNEGPEAAAARKRRNVVIALGLLAFMGLVFWVTILRMGGHGG